MKIYTFKVVIEEGSDEFWEEIVKSGKSGCDDIMEAVTEVLHSAGFHDAEIKLVRFEDV